MQSIFQYSPFTHFDYQNSQYSFISFIELFSNQCYYMSNLSFHIIVNLFATRVFNFFSNKITQRRTSITMGYNIHDLLLQISGKKNLFGYSNTILNQIHLVYWFLGEFYQSTIFNRSITLFWKTGVAYFIRINHLLQFTRYVR